MSPSAQWRYGPLTRVWTGLGTELFEDPLPRLGFPEVASKSQGKSVPAFKKLFGQTATRLPPSQ